MELTGNDGTEQQQTGRIGHPEQKKEDVQERAIPAAVNRRLTAVGDKQDFRQAPDQAEHGSAVAVSRRLGRCRGKERARQVTAAKLRMKGSMELRTKSCTATKSRLHERVAWATKVSMV